ncbi:MAG TPA: RluA family pseudouridine synthase [Chitinivibrionales bacterium]|jgi:RluA family pseudouridine synthase|nr:RluA family pseudouridine synthase [Chitinivibrionales bacterium]
MELPILFENSDLLAVSKPEGLTSIPGSEKGNDTLLSLLSKQYGQKLFVVHRLDKDVSGVMLFAKNAAAHKCLNDQFAAHRIRKTYLALVHGAPGNGKGVINKPIHQYGSGRMGVDELRGKPSSTEYEVVEQCGKFSLVKANPRTGRKHQIRVHFYSIGHPIAGDRLYGDKTAQAAFPRVMLHAQEITFRLLTGEEKTVEAPVPESFTAVMNSLRGK